MAQQIGYCTAPDGVRLAYSVMGQGSPVVRPSHWFTHLDYDLKSPINRHLILGVAHRHRLIRFDARGAGMSQRDVAEISFDRWVSDLETVVDALALERFTLLGISQAASSAIEYAARHPERVERLVLYGGFARGPLLWSRNRAKTQEGLDLSAKMIRAGWGRPQDAYRQWFSSQLFPDATAEQYDAFNELQAVSATPDFAERHLRALADIDVRARLPEVRAPALVLHCRGDTFVPTFLGEEMAAGVPGAAFTALDSANHLALPGEPAHRQLLEAFARFMGDPPPPRILPGAEPPAARVDHASRRSSATGWWSWRRSSPPWPPPPR